MVDKLRFHILHHSTFIDLFDFSLKLNEMEKFSVKITAFN